MFKQGIFAPLRRGLTTARVSRKIDPQSALIFARAGAHLLGYSLGFIRRLGPRKFFKYFGVGTIYCVTGIIGCGSMYCFTQYSDTVPISSRRQLVFLTPDEEDKIGSEAAHKTLLKESRRLLGESHLTTMTVKRIVNDLVEVCQRENLTRKYFSVKVIDAPIANAFVFPNGSIFVYTGLLPYARTEGGLASILGHEISHAIARHSAEKMGYAQMAMIAYEFVAGVLEGLGDADRMHSSHGGHSATTWTGRLLRFAAITFLQLALPLSKSRDLETEADHIGATLAARAGYDPREAPDVWKRMEARKHQIKGGKKIGAFQKYVERFTSTHPMCSDRAEKLTHLAEELRIE